MRVLLLVLLVCSLAMAQSSARRGRQIIDEAITALGGAKFMAMTTKIEKGRMYSFYRKELSGLTRATIYTKYLVAPPKPDINKLYLRERQAFGKKEKWSILFNETGGWEVTYRGARPLSEKIIKRFQDRRQRNIFYILLRRLHEDGLIIESRGTDVIDNRPVEKVEITDAKNRVVTVYFQYSTKLPLRQLYSWRDKRRIPHQELTYYDNYQDVDGVKLPYIIRRDRDGEKIFSMFAKKVEVNVPLTDNDISLPGDIKILKRQN